jgi:predicted aspartyl protease
MIRTKPGLHCWKGTAMIAKGTSGMGRFSVEFDVCNYEDVAASRRKTLKPDKVRRLTINGVVDSGAAKFVLPKAVVQQLGLPITGKVKVRYADGHSATRQTVEGVYVDLLGRQGTFNAIVEPKRETALIGAIILEELDLLVDCTHQRLVPRDPRYVISEIE